MRIRLGLCAVVLSLLTPAAAQTQIPAPDPTASSRSVTVPAIGMFAGGTVSSSVVRGDGNRVAVTITADLTLREATRLRFVALGCTRPPGVLCTEVRRQRQYELGPGRRVIRWRVTLNADARMHGFTTGVSDVYDANPAGFITHALS